ncbi:MAG: CHRD domain-containing protein [Acidobacteriota bacterium]
MKRFVKNAGTLVAAGVVVALVHSPLTAQKLKAELRGYEEVPALSSPAEGSFELSIKGDTLEYELSYSGFETAVAVAHIHLGQPGVAGGVIAFLCGGGGKDPCPQGSGTVTGTITPADIIGPSGQGIAPGEFDEAVEALLNGVVYANVHTAQYPAGEIRGQLGPGFSNRRRR